MKEITLTCHLFRDIEANSEKIEIKVLTSDISIKLQDEIMRHLKEKKGNSFTDINDDDLKL